MRIVTISGSLRRASSNSAALNALRLLAPQGTVVTPYEGLALLPHFDPDLEPTPPELVVQLRRHFAEADALVISAPEYAHGLPGSLKNALDWLVGSFEFPGVHAALINASPRAHHAQDQLREVLTTMSARIVDAACIDLPLLGRGLSAEMIAAEPALCDALRGVLDALIVAVRASEDQGA